MRVVFRFYAAAVLATLLPAPLAAQYESVAGQVSQPNYTHYLTELLFTRVGDSRGPASPQHEAARKNIRDTLASFGLQVKEEPFEYQGGTYFNVVGVLPGKTRPEEYVVIGAHYDSVNNPGADDDASGVAGLLEVARVASLHDFEASVVFAAFDLEEAWMVGSEAWVAAHRGDHIRSMVQMDMIGFNSSWKPVHDQIALCAPDTTENPAWQALWAAVAQYGGQVKPMSGGISINSDHGSFAGVAPAAELIEGGYQINSYYHKAADSVDTPDYIDYGFATSATRAVMGYLAGQAGLLPSDPLTARLSPGGVYNSASFIAGSVAPAEIVTLVGSGFGSQGSITVRDGSGAEQPAAAIYFSDGQINLLLPATLPTGAATITLTRADGSHLGTSLNVDRVAPGVFTAGASGMGAPAAEAVRIAPDGGQSVQNLFECAAGTVVCDPAPVDFGTEGDRVILLLYGTGIRGRGAITGVTLEVDGLNLPVQYAGAQPSYPGLDQVNVELPRTLLGKGRVSVTLRVDGKAANPVVLDVGAA